MQPSELYLLGDLIVDIAYQTMVHSLNTTNCSYPKTKTNTQIKFLNDTFKLNTFKYWSGDQVEPSKRGGCVPEVLNRLRVI